MIDQKTIDDTIKMFECCAQRDCLGCPLGRPCDDCLSKAPQMAVEVIRGLLEEKTNLEKQIDELKQLLMMAKDDLLYLLMKRKAEEGKLNGLGITAMWELNQRNNIEKVEEDWRKIYDYLEEDV